MEALVDAPPNRKTIAGIVREYLHECYEHGDINNVSFEEVAARVRAEFPDSKFNPFHLAWYKHRFLTRLNDIKMYKPRKW